MHIPQPEDLRMREMKRKIEYVGSGLDRLHGFVNGLPDDEREQARAALRLAFRTGCVYSELQSLPVHPPFGPDGHLQLGSELRKHIFEARKVYAKVDQLRDIVSNLLSDESRHLLQPILPETHTDSSATAFQAV